MRISEITISQKKNLGNYESVDLGLTAILDEGEKVADKLPTLKRYVDWQLNKDIRADQAKKYEAELQAKPEMPEPEKAHRAKYIQRFHAAKAEMEAVDF